MIVMGLDWGRSRSGVAISDELGLLAHPLTTLKTSSLEKLAEEICALARERRTEEIVVGLPRNMDGSEGTSATVVRNLVEMLRTRISLPIIFWDERLSTWEAERTLAGRGRREKGFKDQIAACLILQGYLDSKKNKTNSAQ